MHSKERPYLETVVWKKWEVERERGGEGVGAAGGRATGKAIVMELIGLRLRVMEVVRSVIEIRTGLI